MKVLVTGAAGYIGSQISHILLDNNIKHINLDNFSTGKKILLNKKTKFYFLDINEKEKIKKLLKRNNIDCVIHLAAFILVSESMKKPYEYYNNNVVKFINFIEACVEAKVKNFVFSSTCAVYNQNFKRVNEKTPLDPKSIYGKTKLNCENILKFYAKKYKFNYSILRYFNVVGADRLMRTGQLNDSGHLFMNIYKAIKDKTFKINVFGSNYSTRDKTAIRDFVDVEDLSLIHLLILKKMIKKNKSYEINCGTGTGYTVLEVLKIFEKIIKIKFKKKFCKKRPGDIEEIVAQNTNLKRILNYKFKKNIHQSAKTFLNWSKKNIR